MTIRLFAIFAYLFSIPCLGQNITISGTVKDEGNAPIAFANVVLLNVDDASFVAGTTTNDTGVFEIETSKTASAVLKISFLGFEEYTITLDANKASKLGVITLKEKTEVLDNVTVIAKRPTVKRMVDRVVFNVENSTLSNTNVLDVLKHTPGVLVHDGNITVKNTTPTVYINDRKVHLSASEVQQLLEGTPAGNIKSVEVITNPPAKYEAEGGAVLNIVTSKNIIAGYHGSVFGNYKQGSMFPKYSFGTSHFFKTKKLSTYINYNYSPREDFRFINESINFIDDNEITSSWDSDSEKRTQLANQNIHANLDYEINGRNSIGFSTNMLFSPRKGSKARTNSSTKVFSADMVLDSTFNTENRLVDETINLAFTLDYRHKFKKEGEQISASVHHTNYDFSNFQNVDTEYLFPDNSLIRDNQFQTFSSQIIKLYNGQIDYELPLSESARFEAGTKVSRIDSDNILNQFAFENGVRIEDLENSDTFLYDETNYAIYSSFSKDWESWSLQSGLRLEYTDIKGNSLSTNTLNDDSYVKLFPSFYLKHKLNDNNELYLNYSKRIYRPRYNQLNPFKYFLSDNTFITGDPNLKPQIDDQLILGYTFNRNHTFEIYYRYENNPTLQFIFQDNNENLLIYKNTNTDVSISYGLDYTTYTQILPRWNLYVLSSVYYYKNDFYIDGNNGSLFTADIWSLYAEVTNYFTLLKDKSLSLDMSYILMSPRNDGPTDISTVSGLDINLRKTFWNNKASINMGVTDLLNNRNFSTSTKYLDQDAILKFRMENRLFVFGFNYKFGNFRLRTNEKNIDLKERDRIERNVEN